MPSVVEKDYVLGWVLAGITTHEDLAENWVFKGGTRLKKCYFETYRFSEDLDFTLRDDAHGHDDPRIAYPCVRAECCSNHATRRMFFTKGLRRSVVRIADDPLGILRLPSAASYEKTFPSRYEQTRLQAQI